MSLLGLLLIIFTSLGAEATAPAIPMDWAGLARWLPGDSQGVLGLRIDAPVRAELLGALPLAPGVVHRVVEEATVAFGQTSKVPLDKARWLFAGWSDSSGLLAAVPVPEFPVAVVAGALASAASADSSALTTATDHHVTYVSSGAAVALHGGGAILMGYPLLVSRSLAAGPRPATAVAQPLVEEVKSRVTDSVRIFLWVHLPPGLGKALDAQTAEKLALSGLKRETLEALRTVFAAVDGQSIRVELGASDGKSALAWSEAVALAVRRLIGNADQQVTDATTASRTYGALADVAPELVAALTTRATMKDLTESLTTKLDGTRLILTVPRNRFAFGGSGWAVLTGVFGPMMMGQMVPTAMGQ